MPIPKKIHQCHTKGVDALNLEEKSAINKLRQKNPDWEYNFYDLPKMELFIKENYGDRYFSAFKKINPQYGAAQADYFRYLLINKIGGVYLDVKSYVEEPLEKIIREDDNFVVFIWQGNPRGRYQTHGCHRQIKVGTEFQQWNIFSDKENKHLLKVIANVTSNIENYSILKHGTGYGGILRTTGPIVYTNSINEVYDKKNIRIAGNNEINHVIYRDELNFPARSMSSHYSQKNSPIITMIEPVHSVMTLIFKVLRWIKRTIIITQSKMRTFD